MTPTQLHQSVARVTGESLEVIESLGFQHHVVPRPRMSPRLAERLLRFRKWAKLLKQKARRRRPMAIA